MITSDLQHHSSDDAFNPIRALVVSMELFSSSASWKNRCTASSLANTLAFNGMACKISVVHGKGCIGRLSKF